MHSLCRAQYRPTPAVLHLVPYAPPTPSPVLTAPVFQYGVRVSPSVSPGPGAVSSYALCGTGGAASLYGARFLRYCWASTERAYGGTDHAAEPVPSGDSTALRSGPAQLLYYEFLRGHALCRGEAAVHGTTPLAP
eukprot:3937794-Rhodomonas_salina.1